MASALSVGGYILLILGIALILVAVITYKRKGEAEVSQSLIEVPSFKMGIVVVILGILVKIVFWQNKVKER